MIKKWRHIFIMLLTYCCYQHVVVAQQMPGKADTFFLAKKKGMLGRFGKSISRTPPDDVPRKVENPFLAFKGKVIRNIETVRLGFEYNIDDISDVKQNIGVTIGKKLHKNTTDKVIRHNLFFKEGERLSPYLFADNERYLRELVYIKDARILVELCEGSSDSVDVFVLTKDVFSIGANLSISSTKKARGGLREENFMGSGTRLFFSGYHEKPRSPQTGIWAELVRRNISGSFIDWVSGYQDYRYAFTSGRNQETVVYTRIEKPLVTPYIPSTGALEWSYSRTRNAYHSDTQYHDSIRYAYYNLDAWYGYSLDSKRSIYENKENRVHRFVAIRGFKQHYLNTPDIFKNKFDYRFTDHTGVLASLNIFKQTFYKARFIYGFGRSEDIPEGFSGVLTGGFVKKENYRRPYAGLDLSLANVMKKGMYFNYTFRLGGYYSKKRFEDVDLLFNVEHFTRLKKISSTWFQRTYINTGITTQMNPFLNEPLFLNSEFGLRYFNNGNINADLRATIKTESVFYNTSKVLGFRFAPFIFADLSLVKPAKMGLHKSDMFSALGGGVRTRNENLVYGTIELKGYYFPRVNGNMKGWRVELNSNVRFRYISSFIRRPGFIIAN